MNERAEGQHPLAHGKLDLIPCWFFLWYGMTGGIPLEGGRPDPHRNSCASVERR